VHLNFDNEGNLNPNDHSERVIRMTIAKNYVLELEKFAVFPIVFPYFSIRPTS